MKFYFNLDLSCLVISRNIFAGKDFTHHSEKNWDICQTLHTGRSHCAQKSVTFEGSLTKWQHHQTSQWGFQINIYIPVFFFSHTHTHTRIINIFIPGFFSHTHTFMYYQHLYPNYFFSYTHITCIISIYIPVIFF